jgi:hypothetical protein
MRVGLRTTPPTVVIYGGLLLGKWYLSLPTLVAAALTAIDAFRGSHDQLLLSARWWLILTVVGLVLAQFAVWRDRYTQPVTDEHRGDLRAGVANALRAIEQKGVRSDDPLAREMFERHFSDLDKDIAAWNGIAQRHLDARAALKAEFGRRLLEDALGWPYNVEVLAEGLTVITHPRAARGQLGDALPPRVGVPSAIWSAFYNGPPSPRLGILSFNPQGTAAQGNVLEVAGLSETEFHEKVDLITKKAYGLLEQAQKWTAATEIPLSKAAYEGFDTDALAVRIRRMQVKPNFRIVRGCPGCE